MKSAQFRREREMLWRELELVLDHIDRKGFSGLTPDQLVRLPTLYRTAVSSLSVARGISLDQNLLDYLENLAGRAYVLTYSSHRRPGEAVAAFASRRLPRIVRSHWRHFLLSVATMLAGVLTGSFLTTADLERYYTLVPAHVAQGRDPASSVESLREPLYPEERVGLDSLNVFASFLFTHNAKIGILCFALGFLAGVPVIVLLFFNGLTLGAMAALYQARGLGPEFWAWILPHGVTEMLAVCLCGTAGLALAGALIFPGELSRLDNLASHGRRIALIVAGAIVLFFIAALIEGFFRQMVHAPAARWSLAAATLALWAAYFGLAGRRGAGGNPGAAERGPRAADAPEPGPGPSRTAPLRLERP